MNLKLSVFLFISLFITSCSGGKMIVGSDTANLSMSSKDIIKTHIEAQPDFSTIAARTARRFLIRFVRLCGTAFERPFSTNPLIPACLIEPVSITGKNVTYLIT